MIHQRTTKPAGINHGRRFESKGSPPVVDGPGVLVGGLGAIADATEVLTSLGLRRPPTDARRIGGPECVFYGAPEFSQDTDFVICGDLENLARLQEALHQ